MDFIEFANHWLKGELTQAKIMITVGVLFLIALVGIARSEVALLRGGMIPVALIVLVLIGYGGYIMYSRPAHAKQSIELYNNNPKEAKVKELEKHVNDNKAGNMLMKFVYPSLAILSILLLIFTPNPYYKGMAIGFALLFLTTYVMDNGFVTRSNAFIEFLGH